MNVRTFCVLENMAAPTFIFFFPFRTSCSNQNYHTVLHQRIPSAWLPRCFSKVTTLVTSNIFFILLPNFKEGAAGQGRWKWEGNVSVGGKR
jgi:hypothetical protein